VVVRHPGGEKLARGDFPQNGMATLPVERGAVECKAIERAQALGAPARELVEELPSALPSESRNWAKRSNFSNGTPVPCSRIRVRRGIQSVFSPWIR